MEGHPCIGIIPYIILCEKMRKQSTCTKYSKLLHKTKNTNWISCNVFKCKLKCKNKLNSKYTNKTNTQPHKKKMWENAYITITLIITLGNPIKINSSVDGVLNTQIPTHVQKESSDMLRTQLRRTKHTHGTITGETIIIIWCMMLWCNIF